MSFIVNREVYSFRKLFVLIVIFILLGTASAAAISTLVSPITEHPSRFILLTDKDAYYVGEIMSIYLVNTLEETITFKDDAYGLHFEKWVDGKWEFLLSIGDASYTSVLEPVGENMYKIAVTHEIGGSFNEGKYRIACAGEIPLNGKAISVEAHKEFEVMAELPPLSMLLLLNVTMDKGVYHQNDNVIITVKNESNETLKFGDSVYNLFFEKWNGVSWEPYTGLIGLEVITPLNPEEAAEIRYRLGEQTDKPFPVGRYRVTSKGWFDHIGEITRVWGYAEFTVE